MSVTRVLSHLAATSVAATALALPAAAHAEGTGVIRGTVLETGRVIAPGIDVSLYKASGEFVEATVADSSAGAYEFSGLDAGSYLVWFENQNEAVSEWWENQPDKPQATPIRLADGQTFVADAYLTQISENLVRPSITGTAAVGSTLTATRGSWFPTQGVSFSHQWLRGDVPIDGATGSTYTLRDADAGRTISVQTIAMVQGATETATSAPTGPVTGGSTPVQAIANSTRPVVSGSLAVGSVLTATTGAWSPADAAVTLQWLRGDTVVGTGPAYTTTTSDVGASLRVRATATKPGWTQAVAESTPHGPVVGAAPEVPAPVSTAPPTIAGTVRVGGTVTAGPGTWRDARSLAYRWSRNGVAIPGATARSLRLSAADAGKRLAVSVTATNATGAASATSATRVVGKATSRLAVAASSPRKGRLKVKATVSSAGTRTGRVTITVKVGGRTKVVRTRLAKGTRTVTVTGLRKGRATIRIAYAGDASTTGATVTRRATVR